MNGRTPLCTIILGVTLHRLTLGRSTGPAALALKAPGGLVPVGLVHLFLGPPEDRLPERPATRAERKQRSQRDAMVTKRKKRGCHKRLVT